MLSLQFLCKAATIMRKKQSSSRDRQLFPGRRWQRHEWKKEGELLFMFLIKRHNISDFNHRNYKIRQG